MIFKVPEDDILLKECLEALKDNLVILNTEESKKIWNLFKKYVPITGSRIDWAKINRKKQITSPNQTLSELQKLHKGSIDHNVYIMWNDASLPVIETNLELALARLDNLARLGFEMWFYNPKENYVVEYHYSEGMHVGIISRT